MTTYSIVLIAFILSVDETRNPFAVDDVVDPFNDAVLLFAKSVQLKGAMMMSMHRSGRRNRLSAIQCSSTVSGLVVGISPTQVHGM